MWQCATLKAGARRRRTRGNHDKAKSHGSSLAKSLLTDTTCFLVCNDSNKFLPPKVEMPPQYNIPGNASSRRIKVEVPVSHFNNPEEKLYCAVNREEFIKDLWKLQAKTKCTDKTCLNFIRLFGKYVGEDQVPTCRTSFQNCDKKLKEASGVNVLEELNGCTKCNNHVFWE